MTPRATVALLFAALGVAVVVVMAVATWLVYQAAGPDDDFGAKALVIGGFGALALGGAVAGAWAVVEHRMLRPLAALARGIETATRIGADALAEVTETHALGGLAVAVNDLVAAAHAARHEQDVAIGEATAQAERIKSRLAAILNTLDDGILVCTLDHKILLYNHAVLRILGRHESVGLARSLFAVITEEPVTHTLERLRDRAAENGRAEPFVCATSDAHTMLYGRMTLTRDANGAPNGYVLTFADASEEIATVARRDALLRDATEGLRAPLANLRAAAESLTMHDNLDDRQRSRFEAVLTAESKVLSDRFAALAGAYREFAGRQWPMTEIYSSDLLNLVIDGLGEAADVTMVGMPVWLRGESHSLTLALVALIQRIGGHNGGGSYDIEASHAGDRAYIDLGWQGAVISSRILDTWVEAPLDGLIGGMTLRDVLDRHGGEIWSEAGRSGYARLRFAMTAQTSGRPALRAETLPARPEFYDFDLLAQAGATGPLSMRPLHSLVYVVFDTETTGLRPSAGDEIVSIAGVRIVNRRIITGETFDRLIDPGRPIPESSTRFHGITDEMVAGCPPARVVLPQFEAFVEDAVLVAHNAAFDMKFLAMKQDDSGATFDNPVLDTLLLSAYLHDHATAHDLDSIAARFGVEVSRRHDALGDSMVTAAIFLRMIDLLEQRGVRTLGDALAAEESMAELRKRQAQF